MTTLYIRDVDPELHRKFKAKAALEGKTIREYIIELMKKEVAEESSKKK